MALLQIFYSLFIALTWNVLKVVALFSPKIKLFVSGRKNTFQHLGTAIQKEDRFIWMHVASLGEYEQGLPILEKIRNQYPNHKIALTFFSPSGYEVKKDSALADVVIYLPMDLHSNAKRFIDLLNPELAIFVKYEIWPNYLRQLKQRSIPTILVSAIFSKRQIFFKSYGSFMRKSLTTFSHFFVQDKNSQQLLNAIDFQNVTISGDTRFDRVSEIAKRDNHLDFMENFKGKEFCLVAGSTWPEDEEVLVDFINTSEKPIKYVIAPHTMKPAHIEKIENSISKKVVRFSQISNDNLSQFDVIIIDTIGLLTKIYSYADVAYVGGAFATGLHNTLEPAVFGIPVIIGPDYNKFKEAEDLVNNKGIHVITDPSAFANLMTNFFLDIDFRQKTGSINSQYIAQNRGATSKVVSYINSVI